MACVVVVINYQVPEFRMAVGLEWRSVT